MSRAAVIFALIGACAPIVSHAAWDPDGNPVVVLPATQDRFSAIQTSSGGIFVAWVDQRNDAGDIYAMVLDASGAPASGWPVGGLPICTASGEQSNLSISGDGGAAYLRWIDRRSGMPWHALTHVAFNGFIFPGWPVDGLVFVPDYANVGAHGLAPDGSGGIYFAWTEASLATHASTTAAPSARVIRFGPSGSPWFGWPVDLPLRDASPNDFDMIADGAGGFIAVGSAMFSGQTTTIRVMSNGAVYPSWPTTGVQVFPPTSAGSRLIAGGDSDFFVTWVGPAPACPCCNGDHFVVQHMNLDGLIDPSWPQEGEYGGLIGSLAADGSGGILSAGSSLYGCTSIGRAAALRLGADRSRPWDPATTPVCDQPSDQQVPSIGADGAGGAFIGWIDKRDHNTPVLYATRLDAAGEFAAGWPSSGSMEALGALLPSEPRVVATQPGTAIIVWVDRRNGDADIYAKEMVPGPAGPPTTGVEPGGTAFAVAWLSANPARGPMRAAIDLPGSTPGNIQVIDLAGRVRENRTVSAGRNIVTLDADGRMQPGVYWLRVTQERNVASHRFVVAR